MSTANKIPFITDDTFEDEVLKSDIPVMVEFEAPWCGPCQLLRPIINDLAEEFVGEIKFVRLNTDENKKTPIDFQVRGIPVIMLFKNGKEVDRQIGIVLLM